MSERDSRDLRSSWWSRPCGAVLLGLALTATAALAGQARTDYVYDDLGRLVRVERSDGTVITYEYDPAGNIVRHVVMADQDGDGSPNHADCAPSNPNVYPGAPEINDGLDSASTGRRRSACTASRSPSWRNTGLSVSWSSSLAFPTSFVRWQSRGPGRICQGKPAGLPLTRTSSSEC